MIFQCVIIASLVAVTLCSSPCDSLPSQTTAQPPLPEFPDNYVVKAELNIVEENRTVDIVEYFDSDSNFGSIKIFTTGLSTQLIYDYGNDQLFTIFGGICNVSSLDKSMFKGAFGYRNDAGRLHVLDSSSALHFGKQFNEVYIGSSVKRGIPVDHWRGCVYSSLTHANMTVDYYISKKEWQTSSLFVNVPVQAIATGSLTSPVDGSQQHIQHEFNFYAFRNYNSDLDSSYFQTPPGVICPGRADSRPMPQLPKDFTFRLESVDEIESIEESKDIWYSSTYGLLRHDYRLVNPYSLYNNPLVSEITDFDGGVKYVIDKVLGNCTVQPITVGYGTTKNITYTKGANGSYVLQMDSPLQIFNIDKGHFTYVGQRDCRGMDCDVFASLETIENDDFGTHVLNVSVEIYFLASDFVSVSDKGNSIHPKSPVPMQINIKESNDEFEEVYNIFDFDSSNPPLSSFDISRCFGEFAKVQFSVRYPGIYDQSTEEEIIQTHRMVLVSYMKIQPIRLQDIHVRNDVADVFIQATLLDRTSASAQFTYTGDLSFENADDLVLPNVVTSQDCAEFCVSSKNFTCNGFELCPTDVKGSCRLSRHHIGDGNQTPIPSKCAHYSRTISTQKVDETPALTAYSNLRNAVYRNELFFNITTSDKRVITYKAVDTSIDYGNVFISRLPKIPNNFAFNQEVVIPSRALIFESKVWFSGDFRLVRYDYHESSPTPPFYSTNPMTAIHDFTSGVAYTIDKVLLNCSTGPISGVSIDAKYVSVNSMPVLQMKSPMDIFHIPATYRFTGQKTVRNILCDVFESLIGNFTYPGVYGPQPALLRYFFIEHEWSQVDMSDVSISNSIPIKIEITFLKTELFIVFNYFDFQSGSVDVRLFDVQNCFAEEDKHRFQIEFTGPVPPVINNNLQQFFLFSALENIASIPKISFTRLANILLDHDDAHFFLTTTLLQRNKFLDLFVYDDVVFPHRDDGHTQNITSASDCADLCLEVNSIQCDSFDYCPTAYTCFISKSYNQDGPTIVKRPICQHYARTVAWNQEPLNLADSFIAIKNAIYTGQLGFKLQNQVYTATDVRDDIVGEENNDNFGQIVRHFKRYLNTILDKSLIKDSLGGIAIDDCAVRCLSERQLFCEAFSYSVKTGICNLYSVHPDGPNVTLHDSTYSDLFGRLYTDGYKKMPGVIYMTKAKEETSVQSPEMCAEQCNSRAYCNSFDYCEGQSRCLLHENHTLDASSPDLTGSPSCDHYSRDYIHDYNKVVNVTLSYAGNVKIKGVSSDDCAQICSESVPGSCISFVFCSSTQMCALFSRLPPRPPSNQLVATNDCDLYIGLPPIVRPQRVPKSTTSVTPPVTSSSSQSEKVPPANKPTTSASPALHQSTASGQTICSHRDSNNQPLVQYKNSNGTIAGVAVGLFALGVIVGILGLLGFYRLRMYRNNDDLNAHIMRDFR